MKAAALAGLAALLLLPTGYGDNSQTRKEQFRQEVFVRKEMAGKSVKHPLALKAVAEGNYRFGGKLYEKVRVEDESMVMSPYSVSCVMAMAANGARGRTLTQMREVMGFPEEKEVKEGFGDAVRLLRGNENFTLETANKLFVQEGYQLLDKFQEAVKEGFDAEAEQTDFAEEEAARKVINDWVEEKTREKIKDLIPGGVLNVMTRLVLVNAIYFKGDWASKFDEDDTFEGDFFVDESKTVKTKMMCQEHKYKVAKIDEVNAKAVELPYKGERISMYIVLPDDNFGLTKVENKLLTNINSILKQVDASKERKVDLILPKFKLEKTIELTDHLKKLGMEDMFNDGADFSGISGNRDLYVSAVLQKAFIEVNEKGSEAAAATGMMMMNRAMPMPPPKFSCDHPFMFFIKDKLTDIVLFSGRVVDPSQLQG